jgi:predicted DNA-binding protein
MGDNYKRAKTAHTSYRLPDATKNKLSELAEMDGLTKTETLKRLINADYKARLDEIKIFRENRKNEQS